MKHIRNTIKVLWGDCDAQDIVHYPNYLQWIDRSTQKLFHACGMEWKRMWREFELEGVPLVSLEAKFNAPVHMEDELELETWIEKFGNSTFIVKHRIHKGDQVVVEATETRAWVVADETSPTGIKPGRVPDGIREIFED
jgi:4-hydroxybenzoyl-CoA thioesterase